jgi:putative ABC transport system substrate-binding protein
MITRRRLVLTLGSYVFVTPRLVSAQPGPRVHRVGMLSASDAAIYREPHYIAFDQRLSELGFTEGRTVSITRRHADDALDALPALAMELESLKCDVLFGGGPEAALTALMKAGRTTPIVFVAVDFDPVARGDVTSLARPGGRVTGVSALQSSLPAKRLELLKGLLPGGKRMAVLANTETSEQLALVETTASRLGLQLEVLDLKRPPFDYDAAFAHAVRAKAEALLVLGSGLWVSARRRIVELSLKTRMPTVFHQFDWVEAGGLMSYGFNFPGMWRRGAEMVASILRGTNVKDIPMEQPTSYELAVNLKTARALGLKMPPEILLRANRVVE